jgi:hypothetical protein
MYAMLTLLALRYYLAAENRRRRGAVEAKSKPWMKPTITCTSIELADGATEKIKVDEVSPIHTILPASPLNSRCVFAGIPGFDGHSEPRVLLCSVNWLTIQVGNA